MSFALDFLTLSLMTITVTSDENGKWRRQNVWVRLTGAPLAAASGVQWQVPTYMADIRRDWLTNQNTDCCFVVIGLAGRHSHSPLLYS